MAIPENFPTPTAKTSDWSFLNSASCWHSQQLSHTMPKRNSMVRIGTHYLHRDNRTGKHSNQQKKRTPSNYDEIIPTPSTMRPRIYNPSPYTQASHRGPIPKLGNFFKSKTQSQSRLHQRRTKQTYHPSHAPAALARKPLDEHSA